jgi:hypothetical protein
MAPHRETQQAQETVKAVLQEVQVPEEVVAMVELNRQTPTRIVKKTIPITGLHNLATMMANTRLPRLRFLPTLLPTAITRQMASPTALLRQDQMLLLVTVRLTIPIRAIQDNHSHNPLLLLQTRMEVTGRQIKMELADRERIAMRTLLETMLLQPLQILAVQLTALSILTIQHAPTRINFLLGLQHPNRKRLSLLHLNYQRQRRILPLLKDTLPALLLLLLEINLLVVLKTASQTALHPVSLQMAVGVVEMRAQTPTQMLAVALLSLPRLSRPLRQHPPLFQIVARGMRTQIVTMEVTADLIQDLEVYLRTVRRSIALVRLLPM